MKKRILYPILVLSTLIPLLPLNAQILLSGDLNGVLTDTTYLVVDSIRVQWEDSLVIQPGARILFAGYHKFWIYGYLSAVGTPDDSIYFGPAGEDSIGCLIFGDNVSMVGASRSCLLSYCTFTGFAGSAINCYYGGITISHCLITGNRAQWGGGLYIRTDSTVIDNCEISNNQCRKNGGGIYCSSYAAPVIFNSKITGNVCNLLSGDSGHGGGGLCANHSANPIIINCRFSGNHSHEYGGGLCLSDNSFATLSHCLIVDNSCDSSGGGLAILKGGFNPSYPSIINCTIAGNRSIEQIAGTPSMGGGVYIERSTPTLINNIISGSEGESAVCFDSSEFAIVQFCDFYNPLTDNIEGSALPPGLGQPAIVNANGDSCDAYFNILMNPQFVDPLTGNYHLTAISPCIDAGDPFQPYDPDSTIADMGIYYYHQRSQVVCRGLRTSAPSLLAMNINPNPFNPSTAISYELRAASLVSLKVYDTTGRLVITLVDELQGAGEHLVVFDGSVLASGIYLYHLAVGDQMASGKMMLLK